MLSSLNCGGGNILSRGRRDRGMSSSGDSGHCWLSDASLLLEMASFCDNSEELLLLHCIDVTKEEVVLLVLLELLDRPFSCTSLLILSFFSGSGCLRGRPGPLLFPGLGGGTGGSFLRGLPLFLLEGTSPLSLSPTDVYT